MCCDGFWQLFDQVIVFYMRSFKNNRLMGKMADSNHITW